METRKRSKILFRKCVFSLFPRTFQNETTIDALEHLFHVKVNRANQQWRKNWKLLQTHSLFETTIGRPHKSSRNLISRGAVPPLKRNRSGYGNAREGVKFLMFKRSTNCLEFRIVIEVFFVNWNHKFVSHCFLSVQVSRYLHEGSAPYSLNTHFAVLANFKRIQDSAPAPDT